VVERGPALAPDAAVRGDVLVEVNLAGVELRGELGREKGLRPQECPLRVGLELLLQQDELLARAMRQRLYVLQEELDVLSGRVDAHVAEVGATADVRRDLHAGLHDLLEPLERHAGLDVCLSTGFEHKSER
tara:strand:- start:639 stop:1031 length:393 start_codon:yes stop_codon:yes gene_type:complete